VKLKVSLKEIFIFGVYFTLYAQYLTPGVSPMAETGESQALLESR
jgi:hypothetical protein